MQPESSHPQNQQPQEPQVGATPANEESQQTSEKKQGIRQNNPQTGIRERCLSENWQVGYNASASCFELELVGVKQAQTKVDKELEIAPQSQSVKEKSLGVDWEVGYNTSTGCFELQKIKLEQVQMKSELPLPEQVSQKHSTHDLKESKELIVQEHSQEPVAIQQVIQKTDLPMTAELIQPKQNSSECQEALPIQSGVQRKLIAAENHAENALLQQTLQDNKSVPKIQNTDEQILNQVVEEPKVPQLPALLANNSKVSEQVRAFNTEGENSIYEINVTPPAQHKGRFLQFEQFTQKQDQQIQTHQVETVQPLSLVAPLQYWQVFYMGSDFEISQRKKFTDLQELNRVIEAQKRRLHELNIKEDVLEVPKIENKDDHELERQSNKADSVSDHSEGEVNKTAVEIYNVQKVGKGYDTQEDPQAKEEKLHHAINQLEAVEFNRLAPLKTDRNKLANPQSKNQLESNPVVIKSVTIQDIIAPAQNKLEQTENIQVPKEPSHKVASIEGELPKTEQNKEKVETIEKLSNKEEVVVQTLKQAQDSKQHVQQLAETQRQETAHFDQIQACQSSHILALQQKQPSRQEHKIVEVKGEDVVPQPTEEPIVDAAVDSNPKVEVVKQPSVQIVQIQKSKKDRRQIDDIKDQQPVIESQQQQNTSPVVIEKTETIKNSSQVEDNKDSQSKIDKQFKEPSELPSKSLSKQAYGIKPQVDIDDQKPKSKLSLRQQEHSVTNTEQQPYTSRNSQRSKRSHSRKSDGQKRKSFFKMASVISVTVQHQGDAPKINRGTMLNQRPESELDNQVQKRQEANEASAPPISAAIPIQTSKTDQHENKPEPKLSSRVKDTFLKAAKMAKQSLHHQQDHSSQKLEIKIEDQVPFKAMTPPKQDQQVKNSKPETNSAQQIKITQLRQVQSVLFPETQPKAINKSSSPTEVDPDKEAMKEEISQLKKTIRQMKKEIVIQKSMIKLAPLDSVPSFHLDSHGNTHNDALPPIDPIADVARTESIIEFYQRNKHVSLYPDVLEIHSDQKELEIKDGTTPQKMYWHSQRKKQAENVGKIFHRKLSEKKNFDLSLISPTKDDREQFRIRPFLAKITSKQQKPTEQVDQSLQDNFGSSSGFTQTKQKLSKKDLIQKINNDQHNFRKFVKTRSNLAVPAENKILTNSAFVGVKEQIKHNNILSETGGSGFQRIRESSSNIALANPEHEIKSELFKPRSPMRNPMPQDTSIRFEPDRYADNFNNEKNLQRSSQTFSHINNGKPTVTQGLLERPTKQNTGNISKIEDEPSQSILQDLQDKFLDFPNLPRTPSASMNSEELIQLGRQTFEVFGLVVNPDTILNVKKYRNCVYFNALDKHILWHYTGKFYIGGWSMNCKSPEGEKLGQGIEYYPQKYIYEGDFKDGKRHGQGTMRSNFRDIYTGQWTKGLRHGHGILREANGATYQGEWKDGRKDGYGREIVATNDIYEGLFEDGTKNGFGKQTFPNGDSYEGNYHMNKFSGKGTYNWSDGSFYEGEFQNGARHGKGVWRSSLKKGDTYEGEYKNDKKCGLGKYTWQSGVVYTGSFENDLRHGEGIIKDEKGAIHRAIWQNGILKNKLYHEQDKKTKDIKGKRVSVDIKKERTNSNSKPDGEVPLQKRRSSLYTASLAKINDSSQQLSHVSSALREHPYRDMQQPKMLIQNL